MTPRLPGSNGAIKNWTGLPREFSEKAVQVFAQNFREESRSGRFIVDGRIYPNEIIVRVSFGEPGRLRHTCFSVSMDHAPNQNAMEKLFLGIDVLGSVFETHFEHLHNEEEDDVDYPIQWQEFEFDDTKVFLRYSTENVELEEEANRLLGQSEGSLYRDEESGLSLAASEDALLRAEIDSELAHEVSRLTRASQQTSTASVAAPIASEVDETASEASIDSENTPARGSGNVTTDDPERTLH